MTTSTMTVRKENKMNIDVSIDKRDLLSDQSALAIRTVIENAVKNAVDALNAQLEFEGIHFKYASIDMDNKCAFLTTSNGHDKVSGYIIAYYHDSIDVNSNAAIRGVVHLYSGARWIVESGINYNVSGALQTSYFVKREGI